ncbi:MAG TPA: gluconate 2-dehydrogenase subunit 3 family protein [Bryobacteraceae bacterium]|nr:gluconate 2-dehydrogenase subunit 3 family protein [Bryobacteraceae bacterium]
MKRRRFVQSLPLLSSAPGLLGQDAPKIDFAAPDTTATPLPHFFSAPQFAALRRLSDIILPPIAGTPGALAAGAPEFLDFLISESPAPRRVLYRSGLDALNTRAIGQYGIAFTALDNSQADTLLAPLRDPWTDSRPADVFAEFLRVARADILTATVNSREWIAVVSRRNPAAGGIGAYWLPAE